MFNDRRIKQKQKIIDSLIEENDSLKKQIISLQSDNRILQTQIERYEKRKDEFEKSMSECQSYISGVKKLYEKYLGIIKEITTIKASYEQQMQRLIDTLKRDYQNRETI